MTNVLKTLSQRVVAELYNGGNVALVLSLIHI